MAVAVRGDEVDDVGHDRRGGVRYRDGPGGSDRPTHTTWPTSTSGSVAAVIANVRVEYVILSGLSALRMRVWSESSTRWRAPPTSEILVNHHDVPRLYRRSHGHFFEPNTKTEGVSEARNELSLER